MCNTKWFNDIKLFIYLTASIKKYIDQPTAKYCYRLLRVLDLGYIIFILNLFCHSRNLCINFIQLHCKLKIQAFIVSCFQAFTELDNLYLQVIQNLADLKLKPTQHASTPTGNIFGEEIQTLWVTVYQSCECNLKQSPSLESTSQLLGNTTI